MASAWGQSWGTAWGDSWGIVGTPVEVPDVVGETQAAGTVTLETALFVVAVETAYSDSVAEGLIISQSPDGGATASEGSTVTITVSLGVAEEPVGGHYWPSPADIKRSRKSYREEQDAKRAKEERELREAIERAALIEKVEDLLGEAKEAAAHEPPSTVPRTKRLRVFRRQVDRLADELLAIREAEHNEQALKAAQARLDELMAKAADELVTQVAEVLTELIQEIIEDHDAP